MADIFFASAMTHMAATHSDVSRSVGMTPVLQTVIEGNMSFYWLMALYAIHTGDLPLFKRLETVLVKGFSTNFFFTVGSFVGLAVADTLQTRLTVRYLLPSFANFIFFGNIVDPSGKLERMDHVAYLAFLRDNPDAQWYKRALCAV